MPDNGMQRSADTLLFIYFQGRGAAGRAGRRAAKVVWEKGVARRAIRFVEKAL